MSLLSVTTILFVALSTIPNEGFALKPLHNFQEENGLFSVNQMIVEAIAGGEEEEGGGVRGGGGVGGGGGEKNVQTRQKRSPERVDEESKVEYVDEDGVKHTKNKGLKESGKGEGMTEERKGGRINKEVIRKGLEYLKVGIELIKESIENLDPSEVEEVMKHIVEDVIYEDIILGGVDLVTRLVQNIKEHANPKDVLDTILQRLPAISPSDLIVEFGKSVYHYIVS